MNPLQHRSRPNAKVVPRSGGFHVSTNDDGQRDCRCDSACRGASQVSPGVFKKGAPEGCAAAVAGLMSGHRALRARFTRSNDSTHHGPDDLNSKRAWSGRDRRMAQPLPRFILRGRQFLPPLGFAEPTPACLRMEGGLLSADQSERTIMKGGFLRWLLDCCVHYSPDATLPNSAPQCGAIVESTATIWVPSIF
jgi:hypothetical protein